ncbi:disulfide oxidoreductase [Paenibacillus hunanensis]|uniref:disulfide oxidoreductase n=1 Tax=Paenibacillus hunanensis TaxID=539262 RepID=UPI002A69D304|nr:disulfide oxidoreductase [Paenibacillus hunanensis]WPP40218.1 disulfide oxidoreductase [Paenibacillus hunanensis]
MRTSGFKLFLSKYYLYLAWIVAIIATGGSLFLSDVLHWEPCKLCWYQRIFMYPQVILLGIAAYRNDRRIVGYAIPMTIIGGVIAIYHYAKQHIPALDEIAPCTGGVSCSKDYFEFLGFITIPFMALIAFAIITVLLWLGSRAYDEVEATEDAE